MSWVPLGGLCAFILVHLASALPSLLCKDSARSILTSFQDCLGALFGWRPAPSHEDANCEHSPLAERLMENRITYLLGVVQIWREICAVYAVLFFIRGAIGGERLADEIMIVIFLASYTTASVANFCPRLVNKNTMWVMHAWLMTLIVFFAGYVALTIDLQLFFHYQPHLLGLRLTVALAYPNVLANLFWNAAWTIMALVSRSQDVEARFVTPLPNMIADEIIALGFLSLLLWKIEQLQVSQVRSDMEASSFARAKAAMERLLSDMCDAVVELDPQLTIARPCPNLVDLMLRDRGGAELKGDEFQGMMATAADQELFREFVSRPEAETENDTQLEDNQRASSVYLSLRDGIGTVVPVQVFHSYHCDPPREICHIVGVRELESAEAVHTDWGQSPEDTRERPELTGDTLAVDGTMAGQTRCVYAPVIMESRQHAPCSLVLDPTSMEVIGCTSDLQSLLGPFLFSADLRDSVIGCDGLFAWVQDMVNRFVGGSEHAGPPEQLEFPLKLKPQMSQNRIRFEVHAKAHVAHVQFNASASDLGAEQPHGLQAEDGEQEEEETYAILCVLELREAVPRWPGSVRRRRDRGARFGTSPSAHRYGVSL